MIFFKFGTYAEAFDRIVLVIGLVVGFLFGGWSDLLTALLLLHALDILSGVLVGGKKKQISSARMHSGIKKKLGGWLALILAYVIDGVLFEGQPMVLTALSFVLIGNEGLSIVENIGKLGVPLPRFITKYLEQIRSQGDSAEINLGELPSPEVERVIIEDETGQIQELHKDSSD